MMNLFQRFSAFMRGRYGFDTLNKVLAGAVFVIYIINLFVFNNVAHIVLLIINILVIALLIFRMLSRNITKRSAENRAFLKFYEPLKNRIKFAIRRFKDRKDYRYRKCPACKATLRVKNKKGTHTVRCPRCKYEFKTKI
ncbi:MAG TPA: hypothetical protein DEO32_00590 [Ruminococcaceae bacterium]|nr:hypothetical protein [Oscillospiraceae bacterium]